MTSAIKHAQSTIPSSNDFLGTQSWHYVGGNVCSLFWIWLWHEFLVSLNSQTMFLFDDIMLVEIFVPPFWIWRCFLLMSWVEWGLVTASAPMRRWIEFVSCESSHNIEDNTVSIDRSIVYKFYVLHNRLYWYRVYSIVNAWAAMRSWVGSQSLFSKGGQRTLRHLKGWNDNDDHNFLEW